MQVQLLDSMAGAPGYTRGQIIELEPVVAERWIRDGVARPTGPTPTPDTPREKYLADEATAIAHERVRLTAALREAHAREDTLRRDFGARWGVTGWDEQTRAQHPRAGAAHAAARETFSREIARVKDQQHHLDTELDALPRRLATARETAARIPLGPEIPVPVVDLPSVDGDAKLLDLAATRATAAAHRAERAADLDTFGRLLPEDEARVEGLTVRARHGLATAAAVAEAHRRLQDTTTAGTKARAECARLDEQIADLDERITRRRVEATAQRRERLARECRRLTHLAAADVLCAMASMTTLARLLRGADDGGGFWIDTLDADDPSSAGRRFLQAAQETGWTPPTEPRPKDGRVT